MVTSDCSKSDWRRDGILSDNSLNLSFISIYTSTNAFSKSFTFGGFLPLPGSIMCPSQPRASSGLAILPATALAAATAGFER